MPRKAGHLPSGLRPQELVRQYFRGWPVQDFKVSGVIRRDSLVPARWSSTYRRYVHLRLVPSSGRR